MIAGLRRVSDLTNRATEVVLAVIVAFFAALLAISVFSRYLFQLPIVTSIEMTRIAFVWACFLGAAVALKRGVHVRMIGFVTRMPARFQALVPPFVHCCFLVFALQMLWYGWDLTRRMSFTTFPTLEISQAWLYGALPVAGALMTLHALSALLNREPAGHEPTPDEMVG